MTVSTSVPSLSGFRSILFFTVQFISFKMEQSVAPSGEQLSRPTVDSDEDLSARESKLLSHLSLPELEDAPPHAWNEVNEKQLRSALIGACKRMPRNAEAHFHLGLMYMRKCDGEEALRSFRHCKQIYNERLELHSSQGTKLSPQLLSNIARLRAHMAQAEYMAASSKFELDERTHLLSRLQRDLVSSTSLDFMQPDVWNALGLLHLTEKGHEGAREVFRAIRGSFPDYLDVINNLGLAELALGNEDAAISCFQRVILCDKGHVEALSNYGVILLRKGMYDAALRTFESAVDGSTPNGRGLSFAWGGLAIAKGALGLLSEAVEAAEEAERMADQQNKARFGMLSTSMRARLVTEQLRRSEDLPCQKTEDSGTPLSVKHESFEFEGVPEIVPAASSSSIVPDDPRAVIDGAVLRLRALAREIKSSAASSALGMVLRLRHEHSWEDSGNRNFGAEAAERLVEALENDQSDTSAWVQLSLLQLGTGEYQSARDFAIQGIMRNQDIEAAWNALGVATQLTGDIAEAEGAYEKAISLVRLNYDKSRGRILQNDLAVDKENANFKNENSEDEVLSPTPDPILPTEERMEGGTSEQVWQEKVNETGLRAIAALYNNIGNLRRQAGKSFTEVMEAYSKSLQIGGEHAVIYNNIALLCISMNRLKEAEEMLEHALKLDPQLECALSNSLKLRALVRQRERDKQKEEDSKESGSLVLGGEEP